MNNKNYITYSVIAIVALVLCGISFGLGIYYQKDKQSNIVTSDAQNKQPAPNTRALGMSSGPGGVGAGQRPNIGQVTTVSSSSITIANDITNTNQTLKITSNTSVENNGSPASVSDIKTGDTVLIIASSSDSSVASQIMVNPNIGGGQPGGPPQNTPR